MRHCLEREFYNRDTLKVARELLGKYIVKKYGDELIVGRITETEAYIGAIDKACHAYGGKKTPRTATLYMQEGHAYVYFIYGMYYCMNIVTEPEGVASAVLIRGIEIVQGKEQAAILRYGKPCEELSAYQKKNFSNGPGKLCKAMGIVIDDNKKDLCSDDFYITDQIGTYRRETFVIQASPRIGIDYAEEAKDFMWRFFYS